MRAITPCLRLIIQKKLIKNEESRDEFHSSILQSIVKLYEKMDQSTEDFLTISNFISFLAQQNIVTKKNKSLLNIIIFFIILLKFILNILFFTIFLIIFY